MRPKLKSAQNGRWKNTVLIKNVHALISQNAICLVVKAGAAVRHPEAAAISGAVQFRISHHRRRSTISAAKAMFLLRSRHRQRISSHPQRVSRRHLRRFHSQRVDLTSIMAISRHHRRQCRRQWTETSKNYFLARSSSSVRPLRRCMPLLRYMKIATMKRMHGRTITAIDHVVMRAICSLRISA